MVSRSMTSAPTSPTRTPICLKGSSTARGRAQRSARDARELQESDRGLKERCRGPAFGRHDRRGGAGELGTRQLGEPAPCHHPHVQSSQAQTSSRWSRRKALLPKLEKACPRHSVAVLSDQTGTTRRRHIRTVLIREQRTGTSSFVSFNGQEIREATLVGVTPMVIAADRREPSRTF